MTKRFRRQTLIATVVLVGLAAAWRPTLHAQQAATPQHLVDAYNLVIDLGVSGKNVYGSNPSYIIWAGSTSDARTVCSTFISLLLQHSYGWSSSVLKEWTGSTSPTAAKYYDAILAQSGFQRLDLFSDVRAGDIIAIKYPPGGSTSGHTALVADSPRERIATAPIVPGTTQYEVTIIDSSASYHGAERHAAAVRWVVRVGDRERGDAPLCERQRDPGLHLEHLLELGLLRSIATPTPGGTRAVAPGTARADSGTGPLRASNPTRHCPPSGEA